MEPVTLATLKSFFRLLSERYEGPAAIYLLGGSALCLLGSPRTTLDVDYTYEVPPEDRPRFMATLDELAVELHLDLEYVPLDEFIPLPPGARERRQPVSHFGDLEVYVFDLYSIALSKIARGFEADLKDVVYLLRRRLIEFGALEGFFEQVLPRAPQADVIPQDFRDYFEEIRRRWTEPSSRHI